MEQLLKTYVKLETESESWEEKCPAKKHPTKKKVYIVSPRAARIYKRLKSVYSKLLKIAGLTAKTKKDSEKLVEDWLKRERSTTGKRIVNEKAWTL